MKALILAAGKGLRMGTLTQTTPKPLLIFKGKALIEHRIDALLQAGIRDIVINVHHLASKIKQFLGNGQRFGVSIRYSEEKTLLDVGGGIFNALPLLGEKPFITVNADVWTDFPFAQLSLPSQSLGHLVFVDNPQQHPEGDFALENGLVQEDGRKKYTYSGIAVYDPQFFAGCKPQAFPLKPLLLKHIAQKTLTGEYYPGVWQDIGTLKRLNEN